ncbi:methyl-accepting chemotaxis protein [Mesobacterium pallidum]|uniref:methyl-accepting chemotaxis protein n=1 Tax=Mesobacterium pallidum TaxID=2872037 RepID=UPI001EE38BEC|nr:methyl-accepting chemotaxis protein [Mesobacterium pallidum]
MDNGYIRLSAFMNFILSVLMIAGLVGACVWIVHSSTRVIHATHDAMDQRIFVAEAEAEARSLAQAGDAGADLSAFRTELSEAQRLFDTPSVADLADPEASREVQDVTRQVIALAGEDPAAFTAGMIEVADRLARLGTRLDARLAGVEEQGDFVSTVLDRVAIYGGMVVVLGFIVLGFILSSSSLRTRWQVAQAIARIREGDLDTQVTGIERTDIMGDVFRNVEDLRLSTRKSRDVEARSKVENDRRQALLDELSKVLSAFTVGKFTDRIDPSRYESLGEEYAIICQDMNELGGHLSALVTAVRGSVDTVEKDAQSLKTMADNMSDRSQFQAAALEESSAALQQLAQSVKNSASRAEDANKMVTQGRDRAGEGGRVMKRALEAMASIANSSQQITQIIGVIDDIAFQTNLLALNAGVEAARAGESGRGFSVVASEVRSLAQRASESAKEIKALVSNSSQQVKDGEDLVEETGTVLEGIVASVSEVADIVRDISVTAREQALSVEELSSGVSQLDKSTQEHTQIVEDAAASSQRLSDEASRLSVLIGNFAMDAPGKPSASKPAAATSPARATPRPSAPARSAQTPRSAKAAPPVVTAKPAPARKPAPAEPARKPATAAKGAQRKTAQDLWAEDGAPVGKPAAFPGEKRDAAKPRETAKPAAAKSPPPPAPAAKAVNAPSNDGGWEDF